MTLRLYSILGQALLLVFVALIFLPQVASAQMTPAGAYLDRLLGNTTRMVQNLPNIIAAAEAAADNMFTGGTLWLAGDSAFVSEGLGRAGGIMTARNLSDVGQLSRDDVVLLGSLTGREADDTAILQAAADDGALVIFFAPQNLPGDHTFLDASASSGDNSGTLPIISPVLAVNLWTFTGELVAALTRRGKMPPMYQSVLVSGGRERNAANSGRQWDTQQVPPVGAGLLGRTYLARLANIMRRLRATQLDNFAAAGGLAAVARRAGNNLWYGCQGHMLPMQSNMPANPGIVQPVPGNHAGNIPHVFKPGDVVLYVGYYEPNGPWVEATHGAGAKIITVVSGTPDQPAEKMGADININGCWVYGDALVEVPGYDVKILPPSGVIQTAAYWMLLAETTSERATR